MTTPPRDSLEERMEKKQDLWRGCTACYKHGLLEGARAELQALRDELTAFCKSKNWQTDEHWFAAEDLIDFINKRIK